MNSFSAASLPLGRLAGIPTRLHVTFPLVLAVGLLAEGLNFDSWTAVGWAALMYGPILLVTVLLHELGHCLATRRLGGQVEGILLWPLGGLAYLAHASGPKADLLIALAGPLTHVPQFAIWLAILFPVYHAVYGSWDISLAIPHPSEHFGLAVVTGGCQLNIGLAAFNLLLPAYPLDGGRIFADSLLLAGVPPVRAAKVTAGVATLGGIAVIVLGFWWASYLTMAVGLWMLYATWQLWTAIRAGTVTSHPMFSYSGGGEAGGGAGAGAGAPPVQQLPTVGTGGGYARYSGEGTV